MKQRRGGPNEADHVYLHGDTAPLPRGDRQPDPRPRNWTDFKGYGVLPGIRSAEFEARTPNVVGTRIKVTNTDGSSHVEEVVEWQPDRLRLDMKGFSPPLSRLATGFVELWEFERRGDGTRARRSFEMHAKSAFTRPLLWLISILLKGAIARHLRQMSAPDRR